MSQPKRLSAFLTEHPEGTYCYYSDFAALAAENERLRKAGDAMENAIRSFDPYKPTCHKSFNLTETEHKAVLAWLAAKEGMDAK